MYVATLLATPGTLDPELSTSICGAFGGTRQHWLSPGEAVDIYMDNRPANQWQIWQDLQKMAVDLIVQPAKSRRKKILLADMDSTMIEQECIDELAAEAGIGPRVADITARSMNGELDFDASLQERVSLLKGLDESIIVKVLAERISLMPGARILLATMKAQGAYAALVSGGFTAFTAQVAGQLGFDENRANSLLIENGKLTGAVRMPILGRDAKVSAMQEITARLGLTAADVLAVGDGANDLGMLGLAGTGVALHAKPAVAAECDIRINHGDLTALLYLQGYSREEFVGDD